MARVKLENAFGHHVELAVLLQKPLKMHIHVALIGDEATVKYFYPEKDYIAFKPANAKMAPILVRASDFRPTMLLGVVVGVYRKL